MVFIVGVVEYFGMRDGLSLLGVVLFGSGVGCVVVYI